MCSADTLGLPYPPPYLYSSGQDTSSGVNFAVGGSGVTYTSGATPLGTQVDNFELFRRTDPYSKTAIANSLTLVSVSGGDYLYFTQNTSAVSYRTISKNIFDSLIRWGCREIVLWVRFTNSSNNF